VSPESPDPGDYRPPPHQLATWLVLGGALVLVLGMTAIRTDYDPDSSRDYPSRPLLRDAAPVLLPAPPPNDEYLPCDDCHGEEPTNRTRREFEDEHDEMEFAHGDLWCLDCHEADAQESLHLADGRLLPFEESWKLCTQCHGKKLPDWRAGVHGKRTGHWLGEKEYRTCVECHNPHSPPFASLEPEPAPLPPRPVTSSVHAPEEASREER
jgi:hypothetical protein